jgi:hypothetical protein
MTQDFQDSRKSQLVKAMQSAGEQQIKPAKPKSEAQIEVERSAAALALNSVFLRELKFRYGKVERKVTAEDVAVVALADAVKNAQE